SDVASRIAKEATELGITVNAVDKLPEVASHPLAVPRIALVHTWTNTQNEGWYRIELDRLGIPYDYISDQVIGNTPNLRDKWDVIILGPVGGSAQSLVRGVTKRRDDEPPIPWKKSDITPNMGQSPDTTDDMRGGKASIPIDYGITEGVSIAESRQLQARGSVFSATFADRKSPIAYGYDEKLAVYFNQAPLFQVSALGGFGGGGGGGGLNPFGQTQGRPSGRGGLNDPDVPQGRPPVAPPPAAPAGAGEEAQVPAELREQLAAQLPPPNMRPRVVLRFAAEKDL